MSGNNKKYYLHRVKNAGNLAKKCTALLKAKYIYGWKRKELSKIKLISENPIIGLS